MTRTPQPRTLLPRTSLPRGRLGSTLRLVRARLRLRPTAHHPPAPDPSATAEPGGVGVRERRAPSALSRLVLGLVAGAAVLGLLATTLGLLSGPSVGVGDNGDGFRLFCSAGLVPSAPGGATWRGVVVTEFATGADPCTGAPSSAAVVLDAAVPAGAPTFSLTRLGLVYAVILAAGTAVAAVAASAAARRRAAVLAVPLLPLLAVPWWSRFFVSTYFEPAGLLGVAGMMLGLGAVAVTRPEHRWSRLAALALVGVGGVTAATAKPGYVPVVAAAALACACVVVGRRWFRLAGPLVACAVVAAALGPVVTAVAWQDENYAAINTHNLLFTAVLPEVGPDATTAVGLPPEAYARAGEGFYVAAAAGIPGWRQAVAARPVEARAAARAVLLDHPAAAVRVLEHGLTATLRPQLPYLPSAPRGAVAERNELRTVYPEAGPYTPLLRTYLAGIALPWLPAAVVALALAAGAATLVPSWRRRLPLTARLVRVAALAAGTGLAMVAVAVAGDGYYELTKHVWLASYCLLVAALTLVAAGVSALTETPGPVRPGRPGPPSCSPGPPRTGAGTDPGT